MPHPQADWFDTSKGDGLRAPPFNAWTLHCPELATNDLSAATPMAANSPSEAAQPELAWLDYFPLGGRHVSWPPRFVVRQTSYYSRDGKAR
jgi:hypothetical protein